MHLAESTWPEAAAFEGDLAVLPVGSTEQHGPHAPLGTDTLAAEAVAAAGVERTGHDVLIAPVVPVGVAAEHRQFAGSLWVSPDTFRAYVGETIESLLHHGVTRVVVVNGHGGNTAPLREVCAGLTRETEGYAVSFTWFDAIDADEVDIEGAMGHAGPVETSLVQHLRADLVDADQFEAAADGAAGGWGEWLAGVNLAHDTVDFADSGVVGDPGEGSAAIGERLLDLAAERLGSVLDAVAERDIGERDEPAP